MGRVEAGLVGFARGDDALHGIVDVEDGVFGAVIAAGGIRLAYCIACFNASIH